MDPRHSQGLDSRFSRRMQEMLGEEAPAFFLALETESATSVLLNPARNPGTDLFPSKPIPWCEHGRYLDARPVFTFDPLFHAGCYYVMEASSMFVSHVLKNLCNNSTSVRVLDLCAAPGGKSVVALSSIPPGSLLVSNEVNQARFQVLQYNLDKWGSPNAARISMDPSRIPWTGQFDVIIVDAPCSGEGLFRKDKASRTEWTEEHVKHCSLRQKRILSDAESLLAPNGYLIYSTCTYNEEENIRQVRWLKQEFSLSSIPIAFDAHWNITRVELEDVEGYQFYPHKVRGEGFFCAVLQKKEDTAEIPSRPDKYVRFRRKSDRNSYEGPTWLKKWIDRESLDRCRFFQHKSGTYHVLGPELTHAFLEEHEHRISGISVGEGNEKTFTPSHALALSQILNEQLPSVELDRVQALSYLRKEPIVANGVESGWNVARYRGFALGWLKQTQSGLKNYLPTKYRIIKSGS